MSNIIRKVEEAIHPDKRERGPAGAAAHPPAGTGVVQAPAAPGAAAPGANPGAAYPSAGNYTNTASDLSGPAPNTAGPHKYDVLNKLDPSIASKPGAGMTTGPAPLPATTGTGGTNVPEGTYHPHSSRVADAADPRVDSDLDRRYHHPISASAAVSGAPGAGGVHGAPEGTHGPHSSRVANALDPRVDSDGDRAQAAPGVAATGTKAPHQSKILNKLDPEVDSRGTRGGI